MLDNLVFAEAAPPNTLGTAGPTANPDTLSYTAGALDALDSNDTITTTSTGLQATLAAGGMVDGGAGVDTLKLAAGTTLNLDALNGNQTVRPIQEVEIFQMQGTSSLTLSANDVLSLGGSNASTMAGYTFTSTTGGTASASSTGKVQMVITGTASDTLVLDPLMKDGVTTNSVEGNTALAGSWADMGTTVIGGVTYKVYNHSTTQAQVLTTISATVHSNDIAFSSMTKDSGVTADASINSNWITNDTSAGRLISGTVATPLAAGDVVKVYANGTLIGNATVNAAGTAWEITDTAGYNASWVYSANIVSASGTSSTAYQPVNADLSEAAPVITGVFDTASSTVAIANNGTTTKALSSVKGTGVAGDTIYLYDNTYTTLVGSAVVDGSGNWSVTSLTGTFNGSNTFAARQMDAQGNQSALSNQWTVNAPTANTFNGSFDAGNTGFTTEVPMYTSSGSTNTQMINLIAQGNRQNVVDDPGNFNRSGVANPTPGALSGLTAAQAWTNGTWRQNIYSAADVNQQEYQAVRTFTDLASGKMLVGSVEAVAGSSATNTVDLWVANVDVVQGKSYTFSFDYWNSYAQTNTANAYGANFMDVKIDGLTAASTKASSAGQIFVTYVATRTGSVKLSLESWNTTNGGDYMLDNMAFGEAAPANTLGTAGPTANPDNLTYTAGVLDALGSNDTITTTSTGLQATLAAGGMVDGGAGVDTLKLAPGTTLNLDALNGNQTVRPIQEVEIFQMQGTSSLTLSANDVLSLGGSNASTMAGYTFTSTTGGTASASSTGKVQMVITGTASDTLVLDPLMKDGVTTNGLQGNTGLDGQWDDMGTTVIGGVTYKVYNHSTTQAQVLTTIAPTVRSNDIAFSSMTKDSGVTADATINSNWITNDTSAGRLISGTVATPLAAGDVVKVYANGTLIGNATVNAAGTAWEITDTAGYNASWVYSANIVSASGTSTTAYQPVNADLTEAAPVITGVFDTASSTTIANNGTTTNALSTVKGTGVAGDTIYLYDNSINTLVGSAVVDGSGNWAVPITQPLTYSSNTFSAKQVDAQGNQSVLSNLWTVTAPAANVLDNGDFSNGNTGFTSTASYNTSLTFANSNVAENRYNITSNTSPLEVQATNITQTGTTSGIAWSRKYTNSTTSTNPDGAFTGNTMIFQLDGGGVQTLWSENVNVVAGQDYTFKFDYYHGVLNQQSLVAMIDGTSIAFTPGGSLDAGHFTATFRATTTKSINLALTAGSNAVTTAGPVGLDNFVFSNATAAVTDGSLVAGGTGLATPSPDSLSYMSGNLDTLAGNDTITATSTGLQATLAAGGMVNGGAGVDTFKLLAGTTLDLTAITDTQTVKPIEQIEVFELLGSSSMIMSANDVLSLGGANASTMSAYSFASTTQTATASGVQATGSTSSTGKVQFVVNGTTTDAVALDGLNLDGVTTNGTVGNTGLAGQWDYKGTTDITVGSVTTTYRVYNHSTTAAQVLIDSDVSSGTSGNAVAVTNVKATGTTTKVLMETFDNLPYNSTDSMWDFTTANGIQFQSQVGGTVLPNFTQLNGQLVINNAILPTNSTSQWAVMPLNGTITNATFDYNGINNATTSGTAVVRLLNNSAVAAGPFNLANNALASAPGVFNQTGTFDEISFQNMPKDQYAIDNLKLTMTGVAETVDLANGSGTRHTTGVVSGTLAKALSSGQYVEVFSNGVSLGQATVKGTTWSYADTIATAGENYTAKIMSSSATEVAASVGYAINQASGAVPRLTITNDASEAVSAGKTVNYTFRFDQAVTGFTASDVTVTNGGSVSGLTQLDAQTWVMSVNTPSTGAGTTTVAVADGSYNATANNAAGLGATDSQPFDASLIPFRFDGYKGTNKGTAAIDPLVTGPGDDWVTAVGIQNTGIENINTGAGADTIQIMGNNVTKLALASGFATFDGGDGIDRLGFYNGGAAAANITLDLTNVNVAAHLHSFETVDMTQNGAGGAGTLKIDRNAIINLSDILDNPATSGVDESQMLVVNGKAGDTVQLVGGINWTTVTTGISGATLAATYGAGYAFAAADTYREMSYNGATLFIDEAMTRTNM
ncbi:hypothetical protein [Limnohabitans sp. 2KL-51]|uniref:hypothetical protein n=1 Tax=Limnohabitans sp. 2KL-51 TaxID=1977911 RepID=UPI001E30FFD9|nr:hypothetical protein [Limnohabitans sp. 2KL-51]